jgi:hypothetical protein
VTRRNEDLSKRQRQASRFEEYLKMALNPEFKLAPSEVADKTVKPEPSQT